MTNQPCTAAPAATRAGPRFIASKFFVLLLQGNCIILPVIVFIDVQFLPMGQENTENRTVFVSAMHKTESTLM